MLLSLKQCPFCGGKAALHKYQENGELLPNNQVIIQCTHCLVFVKQRGEKNAVYAWNTRIP